GATAEAGREAEGARGSCRASSGAAAVDTPAVAERPAPQAVPAWRSAQPDGLRPAAVRRDARPRVTARPDVGRPAERRDVRPQAVQPDGPPRAARPLVVRPQAAAGPAAGARCAAAGPGGAWRGAAGGRVAVPVPAPRYAGAALGARTGRSAPAESVAPRRALPRRPPMWPPWGLRLPAWARRAPQAVRSVPRRSRKPRALPAAPRPAAARL